MSYAKYLEDNNRIAEERFYFIYGPLATEQAARKDVKTSTKDERKGKNQREQRYPLSK